MRAEMQRVAVLLPVRIAAAQLEVHLLPLQVTFVAHHQTLSDLRAERQTKTLLSGRRLAKYMLKRLLWFQLEHRDMLNEELGGPDPALLWVSTHLSVSEVVLAEFLPQKPVLGEAPQLGAHLAQADQVPAVRQALHDVQLQADRQVSQWHPRRRWLGGKENQKTGFRNNHERCGIF